MLWCECVVHPFFALSQFNKLRIFPIFFTLCWHFLCDCGASVAMTAVHVEHMHTQTHMHLKIYIHIQYIQQSISCYITVFKVNCLPLYSVHTEWQPLAVRLTRSPTHIYKYTHQRIRNVQLLTVS